MAELWLVSADKSDVRIGKPVHDTKESALKEARQCAQKNPTSRIFVGKAETEVSMVLVEINGNDISPLPTPPPTQTPKPDREPSMEEILASIRRIISEDDGLTPPRPVVDCPPPPPPPPPPPIS